MTHHAPATQDGLLLGWNASVPAAIGFRPRAEEAAPPPGDEPVLDANDGHLLTIAPTGAGKGTGCIIPALLRYPGPVIMIDPKGENAAVTARHRRAMGQDVRVLDPFGITGEEAAGLNPFDLIDISQPQGMDDARMMATLLANGPQHPKDPFWDQMATNWIAGLIGYVCASAPPALRNPGEIAYLLHQSSKDFALTCQEMARCRVPRVRQTGNAIAATEARPRASILSVAQSHCEILLSEAAQTVTRDSAFTLDDIRDGRPVTLYLVVPPDKLASHGALLRLWIGVLMTVIAQRRRKVRRPTLFLLDEAAQLGPLPQLRQAMTLMRGYGMRVWSFWQDASQLQAAFPDDWRTIVNNAAALQMFGFNNLPMAEDAAQLTGFATGERLYDLESDQLVLAQARHAPRILRRPDYRHDPEFAGRFDANPLHEDAPVPDPDGAWTPLFD